MKTDIGFNNKIIAGFAFVLAINGFLVLCGFNVSSSFMLACAIISFFASVVQLIKTRISSLKESQKIFSKLHQAQEKGEHRGWYMKRLKFFVLVGDIILYLAIIVGMCLYTGTIQYQNIALADGLTLLTMALLFIDLLLVSRDNRRIRDYKLKHSNLSGGR